MFSEKVTDFAIENGISAIYAIPEEYIIYVSDNKIEFLGTRPYYEFKEGIMTLHNVIQLVPYIEIQYFKQNPVEKLYKKLCFE